MKTKRGKNLLGSLAVEKLAPGLGDDLGQAVREGIQPIERRSGPVIVRKSAAEELLGKVLMNEAAVLGHQVRVARGQCHIGGNAAVVLPAEFLVRLRIDKDVWREMDDAGEE